MLVSLIVAVAENNVIGKNNALPWHLPADMKYFRDTTMGHCVIMGRKNYDSIPLKYRPLEGRANIIVTRQKDFKAEGCIVANSLEEAIGEAKKKNESELFIIGGADIFKQSIDTADKIYYTKIYHSFEGDVYFPSIDLPTEASAPASRSRTEGRQAGLNRWKLTMKTDMQPDEKNKFSFSFCVYEKIKY